MVKATNPIPGPAPETTDEAYFDFNEAAALQDAYFMLRDIGYDYYELSELRTVIQHATELDDLRTEELYQILVEDRRVEDVVLPWEEE